jgi:hypothetical protein
VLQICFIKSRYNGVPGQSLAVMLHGFSTLQFLLVLLVLVLLWYGGLLLFFYLKTKGWPFGIIIGDSRNGIADEAGKDRSSSLWRHR